MRIIKLFIISIVLSTQLLHAREEVNINFSDLKITDFIKLIGKITNKNILITNKINGTLDFISTTPVYDDEVMGILISVLESKDFTLIENGSVYEVVRSAEAAKRNLHIVRPGKKASGALMLTQVISVKDENVDVVAAKIRHLISKTAKLVTMKETNTLLITDYPGNIETIKQVIGDIGLHNKIQMKILPIKHAKLQDLHQQITDISKSLFNEQVELDKVKILVNTDVHGLILIGKEKNIEILAEIISELDQEQNLNEVVQIVNLKNSDVKSVLTSLNEIVSKQTFSDPSLKPNISSSEEVNAIIIIGDQGQVKGLKRIIDELDKEKFQVYVQARIVEINKDDSERIGLKYGFEGGVATSTGLYTLAGNFGGKSVSISELLSTKLVTALGDVHTALALGATLDFLQTNGASQTVSNPSILCVNNKESSIYVGKTLSFQTGEATNSAGGATSSFKREDVGLTLKIKPRVSSNEKVTLDVETVLENVLPTSDSNGQPSTSKQTVTTQAILRHGESIIIGGLVKTFESDIETKVPLLGDIPLLGWFFTHNDVKEQQENLLVILTPYIIDKSEKLSELQQQLGELGNVQRKYNNEIFPIIEGKEDTRSGS